jgi:hypothetical protein
METETIHKFKWFWAWQDDKEEAWLSEMAKTGWHLQAVTGPGSYNFVSGEPRQDVYRLDYIIDRKDYRNYLQLFKDAGWEHMGEMGGWEYFRKTAQGNETPEIYTDNVSKATKYQRLMGILVVFLPIIMMVITRPLPADSRFYDLFGAGKVIGAILMLFYTVAMVKILQRVQQLRRK